MIALKLGGAFKFLDFSKTKCYTHAGWRACVQDISTAQLWFLHYEIGGNLALNVEAVQTGCCILERSLIRKALTGCVFN